MQQEQARYAILIHYGELALKGRNRPDFRRQLYYTIRHKLTQLGLHWLIREPQGSMVIYVRAGEEEQIDRTISALQTIFGIAWLARAQRLPHRENAGRTTTVEEIENRVVQIAERKFSPDQTFAVRVRRADKRFNATSTELEKRFGEAIRTRTNWKKVNLRSPNVTFHVEIRTDATYLFGEQLPGPRGLPVGVSPRVLVLLSGGIDSPVAAYLIAKRGCPVDFIHFTASSIDPGEAKDLKVYRLARHLAQFTRGSRLFLVPYTHFDLALLNANMTHELILFRRFMARVAEQLAKRINATALVTGDNLSQVASQTLSNLVTTSDATQLAVLRPLLTYDKDEIIDLAKRIGTYECSIEPYKDCCALITRHPRTISVAHKIRQMEERGFSDYQKIIDQTLAEAVCVDLLKEQVVPI